MLAQKMQVDPRIPAGVHLYLVYKRMRLAQRLSQPGASPT
jgi:hypothetical protein